MSGIVILYLEKLIFSNKQRDNQKRVFTKTLYLRVSNELLK